MVETQEVKKDGGKIGKFFKNKTNIWMTISVLLAVVLVLVVVWPNGVSKNAAGQKLVDFLNSRTGGGVTLIGVSDGGSNLYEVNVSYQGKAIPVYVTKGGDYVIYQAEKLIIENTSLADNSATQNTQAEVPKTDKPKVEAFVFAYCPYGLQFEKALSPVYALLKNKADINIVYIGAMHGDFEKTESLRQLCILKNYGKDKLWAYLNQFTVDTTIGACSGDAVCLAPLLDKIYTSISVDSSRINSCMTSDGSSLYQASMDEAAKLGISGSPDLVINGVETSVARNPEAIKKAICDAFTDSSKIAECSQTLSTTSATPSFGSGSSSSSSSAASCG